jgi:hypothetical protein
MDAEKEMDIRKIIDNLSEEEKKLINDSANKAVKADKEQEEIQVHETYIDISDAQIISKDDKTIKVALLDNAGRDCILTVDAAAANKTDYGYRINLNHKEPLEYTTMTEIRINKNDVARETSGQIITGIPNTNGEKYVGIDKRNCVFSDDEIVYNLNKSEKYIVLDRNFNFVKELDGESIYKGHFDKKMIQSEDIVKYNTNYHKVNEINLKVPQPQEVKNLQSDFIVFEIPASMISISGIDQLAIKMADDTVAVDKSDILMVEHEGQQKYFMKVSKDKTYQTAANARVSATQLIQYIRSDTCKTKETAVETKEKELQPDKEGQRKEVQHKEVRR